MKKHLKIVLVEDEPTDAELTQRELRRAGLDFSVQQVHTRDALIQTLKKFNPDVILSDFSMPHFDGLSALEVARAHSPHTPFVFVSGTIGEERAVEALKRGATDYVLKDRPARLLAAITRAVEEAEHREALQNSQQALQVSEERFKSFMQNLPARASIRDLQGRFVFVNEYWQHAEGLRATDVIGRTCDEVLRSERAASLKGYDQEVIETRKPVSRTFQTGSGSNARWWWSNYFPIPDATGNVGMIGAVSIDVTDQKTQEQKLQFLAYYDALTGLPNRAFFDERLNARLRNASAASRTALVSMNIDRFGMVNDSLGKRGGDALLREIAARLKAAWPDADGVARIMADSFAGLLIDYSDDAELAHAVDDLMARIVSAPFLVNDSELRLSLRVGIATGPTDGGDAETLFRNAEAALKQAKLCGVRCVFYKPAMNATAGETLMLENKLRRALELERFELYYQPKLSLSNGKIVGVEALIRWNDPDQGVVAPAKFIPLLEETGLIVPVGRWALHRALEDYQNWRGTVSMLPRIAVNVSAIQLAQDDFVDVIRGTVGDFGADDHGLDLEITESVLMRNVEANIRRLSAVRDLGFNIAMDDFGTGYSSLSYLAKLPVTSLKIDRSFVMSMTDDADNMAIASTIISLAHALERKVVAEGVEKEGQRRLLQLLKCDEAQGYLFYKPLRLREITEILEST